jgi:FKBP-type peptidyl-prolyl cis-trans isomerase SlyD
VSDFQVGPETFVAIDYTVYDAEGDVVADKCRLACVFGRGQLLPAIEQVLDGMGAGESRTLTLKARDAYGKRDPKAVLEVDREEFPEDVAPGDRFEVENESGQLLVLRVLEVGSDTVHVDMNHPLAGQDIKVDVSVLEVRPATAAELKAADEALEAQVAAGEEAFLGAAEPDGAENAPFGQGPGLVSVERLLRGPSRSYEKGPSEAKSPAGQKSGDADEH